MHQNINKNMSIRLRMGIAITTTTKAVIKKVDNKRFFASHSLFYLKQSNRTVILNKENKKHIFMKEKVV